MLTPVAFAAVRTSARVPLVCGASSAWTCITPRKSLKLPDCGTDFRVAANFNRASWTAAKCTVSNRSSVVYLRPGLGESATREAHSRKNEIQRRISITTESFLVSRWGQSLTRNEKRLLDYQRYATRGNQRHRPNQVEIEPGFAKDGQAHFLVHDHRHRSRYREV